MEIVDTNEKIGIAAKQVNEILKALPVEYKNKINKNFLSFLDKMEKKDYEFEFYNIEEQELLPETNMILQIIYRNYLCTPEEAIKIDNIMIENQKKYEEEQSKKYDIQDIFVQRKSSISNDEISQENNNLPVEYKKQNIFTKAFNFIKKLFNRRK